MASLLEATSRVNQITGLLGQVAPGRLEELVAEFPEYASSLAIGETLGRAQKTEASDSSNPKRFRFLIKVAEAGIDEAKGLAERCSVLAHGRLVRAMKLEISAQVIALSAGAGTIFLVLYFGRDTRTVISAIASFAGNLLLAGVAYYRTGIGGGKSALAAVHAKLVGVVPELDFLRARLTSLAASTSSEPGAVKELQQLLGRAEQLCKEVRLQAAEVPGGLFPQ